MFELLILVCEGAATVGPSASPGTSAYSAESQVRERLTVRVGDDTVDIRLPASLAAAVSAVGNDGWVPLTDVSITENEIRGRFSYNWMNRPAVRIDRMTGTIEIDSTAHADFIGTCTHPNGSQPSPNN